jgi:hypothetical protein
VEVDFLEKLQRKKRGNTEALRGKTIELIKRKATITVC